MNKPITLQGFLEFFFYVASTIAVIFFVMAEDAASGAPQEAAAAGIALVVTFIPYSFARIAGEVKNRKLLQALLDEVRANATNDIVGNMLRPGNPDQRN